MKPCPAEALASYVHNKHSRQPNCSGRHLIDIQLGQIPIRCQPEKCCCLEYQYKNSINILSQPCSAESMILCSTKFHSNMKIL